MSVGVGLVFIQPFLELPAKELAQKIRRNGLWWWFGAYFLLALVSLFYTVDFSQYFIQLKLLLPMVMVPTGLLAPSFYNAFRQRIIFWGIIIVVFSTGLASAIHYLLNFQAINEQILHSKAVPIVTSINHIYFSILLAFSILLGLYMIWEWRQKNKGLLGILIGITGLNFIFLHLFAVRTGLGGFYVAGLLLIAYYIKQKQRYISGSIGVLGLVLVGIWAIFNVPTLQNRYQNTVKDVQIYLNDGNPNYRSISTRLEAWEVTWQIFKANPVLGVSPADLGPHIQEQYKANGTKLIRENRKGPHNQYLENLAGLGIPGFVVLAGLLVFPVRQFLRNGDWLSLGLFGLLAFAMGVESILERQTGITFFSFFWFYCFMRSRHLSEESNE